MNLRESLAGRRGIVIAVALAVLVGGILWWWWSAREARRDAPPVFYGNVDIRDVNLGFRVAGRVAKMAFDEGDAVRAGAVLAELDVDPFARELREAEANIGALKARLDLLRAGYRKEEIAQARAALDERRATLANAERVAARQTQLAGTGATAQRNVDDAVATQREAEARVRAAEQAVRQQVSGYRKEEIAEAGANLAKAEATAAQTRLRYDDATLRAPADGVLLTRAAEPGAILAQGATVFTLSLTKPVWARIFVAERELARTPPGTAVLVYTDARGDKPYRGRVGYVSPTAEFTPKSVETPDLRTGLVYRARVVVEDADDALRQGMPVTVRLASDDTKNSARAGALATR